MDQIVGNSAIIGYLWEMVKKIILFPVYLLSIFSGAKNFRDNYIIGSPVLNSLGLHVFRIILSRGIWKLRQAQLSFLAERADRKFYNENGYLVKNNFLDEEIFNTALAEIKAYNGEARQCIQGDTVTWRVFLDSANLGGLPALRRLTQKNEFLDLLKYASAKNAAPLFYIQQVRNGGTAIGDPQKHLHSDTFHPTMKAWLFMEDVPLEKGPFTYVPGSNRLSLARLKWEYEKSNFASRADKYSAKGSFRVEENELASLGLPAPKSFAVAKNTLVIANTNGFHARGQVVGENVTRLEIWAYSRPNPFNPLIGIDSKILQKLSHRIYQAFLAHRDKKAAKSNTRATWHKVSGSAL